MFIKCKVNFKSVTNVENEVSVLAVVNVDLYQSLKRFYNELNISI